jgi:hypothetical protein
MRMLHYMCALMTLANSLRPENLSKYTFGSQRLAFAWLLSQRLSAFADLYDGAEGTMIVVEGCPASNGEGVGRLSDKNLTSSSPLFALLTDEIWETLAAEDV